MATATKESDKLNRNLLSPGVWQQNYHNAVYDPGFLPVTTAVKLDRHWLVDFRYVWWRMEEEQRLKELPSVLRTTEIEVFFRKHIDINRDCNLRNPNHTFNLLTTGAQSYSVAALMQASYSNNVYDNQCATCKKGQGPWADCVKMRIDDGSGFFEDYKFLGGHCTNCRYSYPRKVCEHGMTSSFAQHRTRTAPLIPSKTEQIQKNTQAATNSANRS
jgi:hypothetical protein